MALPLIDGGVSLIISLGLKLHALISARKKAELAAAKAVTEKRELEEKALASARAHEEKIRVAEEAVRAAISESLNVFPHLGSLEGAIATAKSLGIENDDVALLRSNLAKIYRHMELQQRRQRSSVGSDGGAFVIDSGRGRGWAPHGTLAARKSAAKKASNKPRLHAVLNKSTKKKPAKKVAKASTTKRVAKSPAKKAAKRKG